MYVMCRYLVMVFVFFFFSSRRRHTRLVSDWSSDVCSSDLAMGLTLIWGVMNVINLTHGAIIVLGMFAVYFLATAAGLSPYGGLPLVIVLGFLFGVVLYWVAVNRVVGRPVLMSLLATFSMNMILIGLGTA